MWVCCDSQCPCKFQPLCFPWWSNQCCHLALTLCYNLSFTLTPRHYSNTPRPLILATLMLHSDVYQPPTSPMLPYNSLGLTWDSPGTYQGFPIDLPRTWGTSDLFRTLSMLLFNFSSSMCTTSRVHHGYTPGYWRLTHTHTRDGSVPTLRVQVWSRVPSLVPIPVPAAGIPMGYGPGGWAEVRATQAMAQHTRWCALYRCFCALSGQGWDAQGRCWWRCNVGIVVMVVTWGVWGQGVAVAIVIVVRTRETEGGRGTARVRCHCQCRVIGARRQSSPEVWGRGVGVGVVVGVRHQSSPEVWGQGVGIVVVVVIIIRMREMEGWRQRETARAHCRCRVVGAHHRGRGRERGGVVVVVGTRKRVRARQRRVVVVALSGHVATSSSQCGRGQGRGRERGIVVVGMGTLMVVVVCRHCVMVVTYEGGGWGGWGQGIGKALSSPRHHCHYTWVKPGWVRTRRGQGAVVVVTSLSSHVRGGGWGPGGWGWGMGEALSSHHCCRYHHCRYRRRRMSGWVRTRRRRCCRVWREEGRGRYENPCRGYGYECRSARPYPYPYLCNTHHMTCTGYPYPWYTLTTSDLLQNSIPPLTSLLIHMYTLLRFPLPFISKPLCSLGLCVAMTPI